MDGTYSTAESKGGILRCLTKRLNERLVGLRVRELDGLNAASVVEVASVLVARRGGLVKSTVARERAGNDGALVESVLVLGGTLGHLDQLVGLVDQVEGQEVSQQQVQQGSLQSTHSINQSVSQSVEWHRSRSE